jgi:hypothetical protein
MADITYTIILQDAGIRAFTMPDGFWPDVQIYCWGAGGGSGWDGALGGGGGYAKTTVNLVPGDEVSLQIGQPGLSATSATVAGAGGLDTTFRRFRGGNGGGRGYWCGQTNGPYPSGGGGGASWVAVNTYAVCVAAGGGGGGGYGHNNVKYSGNPGGVYSGLTTIPQGGDAIYGGGGGAGYLGGISGYASGHEVTGGNGGLNYGDITLAGSGIAPGGTNTDYYPGDKKGTAGYPGYIAIVLRKKLNVFLKDSGSWANVAAAYTKIDSDWKQIQSAWVKVSNAWKPIITNKTVDLYNWPTRRIKANIIISSDTSSYDLFSNIPAGIYWGGLMDIDVWVLPGVVITDTNNTSAFTISGFTTNDNLTLHNYGTIQGEGGIGGVGGYIYTSTVQKGSSGGKSSSSGGKGGGGGGGGGGAATGSQGGGGAGFGPGANAGTLTAGGAGGTSGNDGGAGGGRGQAGSPGQSGAVGGAPGYALVGNAYLKTESVRGNFYGPVV